jgi:hypothetical protein
MDNYNKIKKISKYVYKLRNKSNNPINLPKYYAHFNYHINNYVNKYINMSGGSNTDLEELASELAQLKELIDKKAEIKKNINTMEHKRLIDEFVKNKSSSPILSQPQSITITSDSALAKQNEQIAQLEKEKTSSVERIRELEEDKQKSEQKLSELENKIKSVLNKILSESEVKLIFQ